MRMYPEFSGCVEPSRIWTLNSNLDLSSNAQLEKYKYTIKLLSVHKFKLK